MGEKERIVDSVGDATEATQNRSEDDDGDDSLAGATGAVRTKAERTGSGPHPDDAAELFLELEADLDGPAQSPGTRVRGTRVRGLVTGAERLDAAAVPDQYPLDLETDRVIALTVDIGGDESTVYMAWPEEDDTDNPLRWLLDALSVRLGDLYGHRLLIEWTGQYYSVVTPRERPRSSGDWGLGVAGGHALNVVLLGVLVATGGLPAMAYPLWAVLTFIIIPYVTYKDGWYVRTHSDWDHGPLFWATLSALPILNVLSGLAYSWTRRRAAFFGSEPSLLFRAVRKARSVL